MAQPSLFHRLASWAATASGTPAASIGAAALVAIGAACGPMFRYSETWQLVIDTGTTIVTFLMVFLIQSSQNRGSCAVHLKLDEIISALQGAKDELTDLEGIDQAALDKIREEYVRRAEPAMRRLARCSDAVTLKLSQVLPISQREAPYATSDRLHPWLHWST